MVRQGDIILINFSPTAGHEQKGYRPAVVVSNDYAISKTNMVYIAPIANTARSFPLHVAGDKPYHRVAVNDAYTANARARKRLNHRAAKTSASHYHNAFCCEQGAFFGSKRWLVTCVSLGKTLRLYHSPLL